MAVGGARHEAHDAHEHARSAGNDGAFFCSTPGQLPGPKMPRVRRRNIRSRILTHDNSANLAGNLRVILKGHSDSHRAASDRCKPHYCA